jgi:hypothetical protein
VFLADVSAPKDIAAVEEAVIVATEPLIEHVTFVLQFNVLAVP